MTGPGWLRIGAVATVCALAGAGAGIAGSTAATSTTKKSSSTKRSSTAASARMLHHRGARGGPVHAEAVVLDKAGKAYITVTSDRGTVKEVSGDELTVKRGSTAVPYADVTLTIASDATIVRNGKEAKLGDLKAGDDVHVSRSSDGTVVFAHDDTFRPRRSGPGRPGGPHGPGGRGGHPGPPPGMPGPPPGMP